MEWNVKTLNQIAAVAEIAFLAYVVGVMAGFDKARLTVLEGNETPCAKRARKARENRSEDES